MHGLSEIWQLSKIKAALNCLFKGVPGALKILIQIIACMPANHGNPQSGNKPCQRAVPAFFNGFLNFYILKKLPVLNLVFSKVALPRDCDMFKLFLRPLSIILL